MMVHTARGDLGCRAVRRILHERGLEARIRLIVGGAPYRFDPHLREAEFFGCRAFVYAADGPPNVGELVLQSDADILRLEPPTDLAGHPAFEASRRCMWILRREAGGRYPICAYLTATMTLPALLMGMEKWLQLLLTGPAELRDLLLEKCHAFFTAGREVPLRDPADAPGHPRGQYQGPGRSGPPPCSQGCLTPPPGSTVPATPAWIRWWNPSCGASSR